MTFVDLEPVKKELFKIPHYIVLKLYRWVDGVEKDGIDIMRTIPGFHDEPLKGGGWGNDQFASIRLIGLFIVNLARKYCFYTH